MALLLLTVKVNLNIFIYTVYKPYILMLKDTMRLFYLLAVHVQLDGGTMMHRDAFGEERGSRNMPKQQRGCDVKSVGNQRNHLWHHYTQSNINSYGQIHKYFFLSRSP